MRVAQLQKVERILICGGTGCMSSGSVKVMDALKAELAARQLGQIEVVMTGCHGFCEQGPLVIMEPQGVFYRRVQVEDISELVQSHIIEGNILERLLYQDPGNQQRAITYRDVPFYAKQQREVLHNCGHIDPENIQEYIAAGGYQALEKVLREYTPQQVIEDVKKSGLRGRGGGGFPTGLKWEFTSKAPGEKKYVVCNADEGDPGAFMDRSVLEGDPHAVLEGMLICGYAIGADEGYIYVRAEYPLAIKRLKVAIAQAEAAGYLGDNILGSNFSFRIKIKAGAGAFVCGEETALLNSIEGERGMPRPRPPFPAVKGLWGKPTNINNVETFANVPLIFRKGADWYAAIGTEKSKGTKVFAMTGKVNNTGLVEVPMGITMRQIIFDIGGGIRDGKKFKAVQIGGPSGGCLPESLLDLPIDYDSLIAAGAMMGSGGLVIMDETTCMVDLARFFLNFTQKESCGKCTPCREGTKRMLEILQRICAGEGREGDIETLERLARVIKSTSLCGLGQTAPNPVLSTLRYFRDEYEAHIREKRCPAGVCSNLLTYYIDAEKCIGCGLCKKNCPVGAISGNTKEAHVIDPAKCIKCGVCMSKCKFGAVGRK
ncbi:MAG: NADH-quinone oxidoreductase subunit NuoF [Bacillota bacterium]|uniref:NAD(P)-dependent iron-only hydrogenase diaphorase component flavoprotein n=2 Tax=Carboxydocella TaxID=178898 RepID=A0A1T4MKR5_9FIRM|nr:MULTISPECIES: NADH-quinone oxidoreductase subunit NuoF [Carboxydocella]AVX21361.1 NADH-quinone oxidoreductase subunit F [Carboxydocella thermautotrophica]GAW28539.1 NADH dehydrogenase [Carboxydocella sp. ULO1]GAW32405.1 NADH dehydrogenase [Carboxydocella sp. JDF658]SJZ67354.1 NAD(P)-dependent iron-only hydrogenase diaphorase component flavoprotein [Carboxydocella sporoproducens DSM 16521]